MGAVTTDVVVTPLQRIKVDGGDVLKGVKNSDKLFQGFGEAYFSCVEQGFTKGWKRHRDMTSHLIVPSGCVKFIFIGENNSDRREIIAGDENYIRIVAPPGLWMAFSGLSSKLNLVLNIANIEHRNAEEERLPLESFPVCSKE